MENISLFNVSTERPGLGKNVVSVDGTGGTINNLNFIAHRFEGDNGLIGDTTPLLNLNALNGSANMIYPWFAGNCTPGCNPPWVNISGSLNQFTMLGAASFSAGGVTNAADGGRTISGQDYIPYYFYSASGNQGVIAVSPQVYSSPGNTDLNLHINSGGSSGGSSHTTNLFFDDQNVSQWNLQKPSSNLIQLLDSVNNLARMVFIANGSTIIGSGNGANPVTINQKTNAGTGGLQVYSGGATPAIIFSTNSTGVDNDRLGFKHKRGTAGCATSASAGAVCTTTVTWTTAFADADYTAQCNGRLVTSGVPVNGGITAQIAASVTFQTVAATAAAAQFTNIDCIAVHD